MAVVADSPSHGHEYMTVPPGNIQGTLPMAQYKEAKVPADGQKITISAGKLNVPDKPVIPFIEGDGTVPDIWRASVRVFDAAVQKAYAGQRKIAWMQAFA